MYKIHPSKASHWLWGLWDHTATLSVGLSKFHESYYNPLAPQKTIKSGQSCLASVIFSLFPQKSSLVSAKYNRGYENIQTLGWWWVSTQIQSWHVAKLSFRLGFLYQTFHKYIKLEIDKTGTKQQGVHLASPRGLYKLKVGQSQTTPATATQPIK